MEIAIHEEMTREALQARFSPRALEIIIAANKRQDSLRYQFGHDEYHFDNDRIEQSNRYIIEQRGLVIATLLSPAILGAWIAFGRLIHSVQDFYSHTNYVSLWLDQFNGSSPAPTEIDPVQKKLLQSPSLHSGKLYLPFDLLYFVPPFRKLSLRFSPRNSHAHMNLDAPAQGARFEYARAAAVKRTQYEFELLEKILTPEMYARFTDLR